MKNVTSTFGADARTGKRRVHRFAEDPDSGRQVAVAGVPTGGALFDATTAAAAAPARVAPAAPVREVSLDPACVDQHLVALTREDLTASAEYDRLAVGMIVAAAERPFRRVLVGSAGHGDGRTTVALNLAAALASAGQRVLLVDADFSRPSSARMLGIEAQVGLAEAIDEGLPLGEVAVRVSPFGFDLAPLRQPAVKPIEPLASPAFQALLTAADESYDFVLFDSPPLSEAAALGLLVRLVDTALLVVRAGATSSLDMARAIAPLRQENVLGVVLNRAAR